MEDKQRAIKIEEQRSLILQKVVTNIHMEIINVTNNNVDKNSSYINLHIIPPEISGFSISMYHDLNGSFFTSFCNNFQNLTDKTGHSENIFDEFWNKRL